MKLLFIKLLFCPAPILPVATVAVIATGAPDISPSLKTLAARLMKAKLVVPFATLWRADMASGSPF
jgi:hypothetical protein